MDSPDPDNLDATVIKPTPEVKLRTRFVPAIAPQDLTRDPLIVTAPRVKFESRVVPALGGIPLLAKLGQGGMGAVYYGINPRLGKDVAIKVLPFHLASQQPEMIQRFYMEAHMASAVQSPHLVAVYDVHQEAELFFITMEFVAGKSAGAFAREQIRSQIPLKEEDALQICAAACKGLAAAHAEGIIHRDIKPDNILIPKKRGHNSEIDFSAAKLADLGLARGEKFDQNITGSHACMGTPGYMAPEQAMDAKKCGKPADVFSMGATLYSLLSGQAPFVGSSLMQVLLATSQQPHKPLLHVRSGISRSTVDLIDKCLAKEIEGRFPDGSALLEALIICQDSCEKTESCQIEATHAITKLVQAPEVGKSVRSAHISSLQTVDERMQKQSTLTNADKIEVKPYFKNSLLLATGILIVAFLIYGGIKIIGKFESSEFSQLAVSIVTQESESRRLVGDDLEKSIRRLEDFILQHKNQKNERLKDVVFLCENLKVRKENLLKRNQRFAALLDEAEREMTTNPDSAIRKSKEAKSLAAADMIQSFPELLVNAQLDKYNLIQKYSFNAVFLEKKKLIQKELSDAIQSQDAELDESIARGSEFLRENIGRPAVELVDITEALKRLRDRSEKLKVRKIEFLQVIKTAEEKLKANPQQSLNLVQSAMRIGSAQGDEFLPDLIIYEKGNIEKLTENATKLLIDRFESSLSKAEEFKINSDWINCELMVKAALQEVAQIDCARKITAIDLEKEAATNRKSLDLIVEATELRKAKKYTEAIKTLELSLQVWPNNPKKAELEDEIKSVKSAIRAEEYARALTAASEHEKSGEFVEAASELKKAIDIDPESATANARLKNVRFQRAMQECTIALRSKNYEGAVVFAQSAYDISPQNDSRKLLSDAKYELARYRAQAAMALNDRETVKNQIEFMLSERQNDVAAGEMQAESQRRWPQAEFQDSVSNGIKTTDINIAFRAFDAALRVKPGDSMAIYWKRVTSALVNYTNEQVVNDEISAIQKGDFKYENEITYKYLKRLSYILYILSSGKIQSFDAEINDLKKINDEADRPNYLKAENEKIQLFLKNKYQEVLLKSFRSKGL